MCGIAGYFLKRTPRTSGTPDLPAALEKLAHRGPDGSGIFMSPRIGLGHRRLSILDLSSAGSQPIHSEGERFVLVFNGEIYNFIELREELERKGITFRGNSDSEVLVNAVETWGPAVFPRLNGIFAFAAWDTLTQNLYLVRDRVGVKPLYYLEHNGTVLFASEIKAILAQTRRQCQVNYQALSEFLYYGNALGENTLFARVNRLLPGHYITINQSATTLTPYWRPNASLNDNDINFSAASEIVRDLLEQAVKRQLVADVPVGIFLSGGVDSSAIAALAARNTQERLTSFCAAFDFNNGHDELAAAKYVAERVGTDHHELHIRGADLEGTISNLVQHHDEPFGDAADIPLYLLTKEIKDRCKVVLQGDGGDELFAGYSRYRFEFLRRRYRLASSVLRPFSRLMSQRFRQKFARLESILDAPSPGESFARLLTLISREGGVAESVFSQNVREALVQQNPFARYVEIERAYRDKKDLVQRLLWVDFSIILPDQFLEKVDKSTMANGVEVRVPFLDNDLVEFALQLKASVKMPNGKTKALLRNALRGVVPSPILKAPKKGFGVPHLDWLAGPLLPFFERSLDDAECACPGILNRPVITKLIQEFLQTRSNGDLLWRLLNLSIWMRQYQIAF
jgi:asparagine synthase (glutamine-hydrolysing)